MSRFLIRRLLNMIPLLLGITFISFVAMSLVPGDFVSNLKLNPTITPEVIHQLQAQFGLDQPLMVRYAKWLWGVLHLNFGFSLSYRVSVTGLIASRAFNTIILSLCSMIFAWMIAIPFVPRFLRDVGAEFLSRLPDDVSRAEDRMVPDRRNFFRRLCESRSAEP